MRYLILTLVAMTCVWGCVVQRAEMASRAQTDLIGMSKKDLLA
jgi:hypothetical protein